MICAVQKERGKQRRDMQAGKKGFQFCFYRKEQGGKKGRRIVGAADRKPQQKEQQKKHDGKGGILSCEKPIQTAIGQAGVFAIGNHIPAEPFCFPDGGGSQVIPKLLAGDPASGEQGVAF